MARPRRSENIRQELLELGVDLLSEHGYYGTGLKQILDAAGVPKGSFYNYFPSKEAYAAEIIEFYMGNLLKQFDTIVANHTGTPLQIIRFTYRSLATLLSEKGTVHGCLMGSLAAEIASSSELCRTTMCSMYREWKTRFVDLLIKAQEQGEVRTDISADILSDMFWNQWEGAMLRAQMERDARILEDALELTLDRFFKP